MRIAILNQKGGVGKTTLAIHIAHCLALRGSRVILVDGDPQGSARDWAAMRSGERPFPVIGLDRPTIHLDLPELARDYDHAVIDGPPRVSDLTRSAILASDLIVIPVQPSPLDCWAAHEIVELIQEAAIFKPNLSAAFVINRKIVNTAIARDVGAALGDYPIPVLEAAICQRVSFAEALNTGSTVLEQAPTSAAAKEIFALVAELVDGEGRESDAA